MFFSKVLFLFAMALVAAVMGATPHMQNAHRRHHIKARVAAEESVPTPVSVVPRKRSVKRCKASSSSVTLPTPTPPPVNAGGDPPVFSTTSTPPAPPAPTQSQQPGNPYLGPTHSGDATWYSTGLGACGITNTDTDYIVAVSKLLFDVWPGYAGPGTNPNLNPICNLKAIATYGDKSVPVTITDRCEACAMFSLDFSPSAFSQLADMGVGRLHNMTWHFV